MQPNLTINIGRLRLKNPVIAASGTFGYAEEFKGLLDLKKLGGIVSKTITLNPRKGNLPPRTCETPAGMLNSIGLENPGLKVFIKEKLPVLKRTGIPIIVSIASETGDLAEFKILAQELNKIKKVDALELNISCPNVVNKEQTGKLISQDPKATYDAVKTVRKNTKKTLITKLSPNVTDIAEIALAAQTAGSNAVSLINTVSAMSINIEKKRPKIASGIAGLSGPAIRPIAVRMVWEVYQKVKIPIIGMGGIMNTSDAIEFFLAGSSAVAIGTANLINTRVTVEIIEGIKKYMIKNKIKDLKALTGGLRI